MLDQDRVDELFASFGPVERRRMFSGAGLYADGVIFALEIQDTLYLKSNATTDAAFEAEGCKPFSYDTKTGRRVLTSYRRAPERLLDEPDEMAEWARKALAVSRASQSAPKRKRKKAG